MNFIQRYQPDITWVSELDRLFDHGFQNTDVIRGAREAFHESDDSWILRLDLPGFSKEDIALTVADSTLKLIAETPADRPFGGKLERQWKLGESVDPNGVAARLENGVLEVRLAKRTPVVPEPVTISIQ